MAHSLVNKSVINNTDLTLGACCGCSTGIEILLLEIYSLVVTISKELGCKFSLIFICCTFGRVK